MDDERYVDIVPDEDAFEAVMINFSNAVKVLGIDPRDLFRCSEHGRLMFDPDDHFQPTEHFRFHARGDQCQNTKLPP